MNTSIPDWILKKWQDIADLIAELINVPAALIMKFEEEQMKVFISSKTENNPYSAGDREKWYGLYCETVINSQNKLLIPNALKDKRWDKNPDIKLGMIAYLGYPVNYPDKTPFGTICVLDSKENKFTDINNRLLLQFKEVVEDDLVLLQTFGMNAKELGESIVEQHQQLKEANKGLQEKVTALSNKEKEIGIATQKLIAATNSLQENEKRLNAILDHHYQLTGLLDIHGRLLIANKTALELINVDESAVLGKYFWDCPWWVPSQEPEVRAAFYRAAIGEFVRFETTHLNSKNETLNFDFSLKPVFDDTGNVVYVVPEGRNITEEKNTQEKFQTVFKNNPLAISITTIPDGKYIDVNPMLEKLSGFKKQEIIGKTIHELGFYANPGIHEVLLEKLQQKGNITDFELTFKVKSGEHLFCRLYCEIIEIKNEHCLLSMVYNDTDRKMAEMAEMESKKRFENLVEMLPEAVFETDKDLNLTYVNKRATDIFGYSKKDLRKGLNGIKIIAPADRERYKLNFSLRLKGADPGPIEYRSIKKDGTIFPSLIHAGAVFKNNSFSGLLGIVVDISERKKAENELLENEKKFRTVFESANDGIFILYGNKFVECNSKVLSMFGFDTKKEIIGLSPSDVSPEKQPDGNSSKAKAIDYINSAVEGVPQRFDWKHKRKDGTMFDAEVSLNTILIEDKVHIHAIVRDVTARIQAELKLIESETRFKRLFEDLGDAVYVTVLGGENMGKILEANPAAIRQTGYTRSELLNMNIIKDLYVSKTGNLDAQEWEDKISGGELITSIEKKIRKDGTEYWTEILVTPINFKGENACLSVNRDITNRIRIEEDLKLALQKAEESDRLKSAFLASMSHEIRTPLNAIIGFSNIIASSATDPKMLEFSLLINKQNDLLLKLINDILDFAKVESKAMNIAYKYFDLNNLIDDLYLTFYPELSDDNSLIPKKIAESIEVYSDQHRIKQVFSNLIANALKFTLKGRVTFGYNLIDKDEIRCFVKDTGIGIPQKYHDTIFDRFVKVDPFTQGTGLGLPISKSIIELLGGKMWFESEPGKGSVFYFTIPCKKEELEPVLTEINEASTKSAGKEINKGEGCTILVAEDDTVNFLYIRELITSPARHIIHAANGLEAFELVKANDEIDLILMDIKMPIMDGYEATRLIKSTKSDIPVIALTAFALPEDRMKAKDAGCDDYIAKPINKGDLIAVINKNLKRNR